MLWLAGFAEFDLGRQTGRLLSYLDFRVSSFLVQSCVAGLQFLGELNLWWWRCFRTTLMTKCEISSMLYNHPVVIPALDDQTMNWIMVILLLVLIQTSSTYCNFISMKTLLSVQLFEHELKLIWIICRGDLCTPTHSHSKLLKRRLYERWKTCLLPLYKCEAKISRIWVLPSCAFDIIWSQSLRSRDRGPCHSVSHQLTCGKKQVYLRH